MTQRILFVGWCALVFGSVSAQQRSYIRPAQIQRSTIMDRGDGRTLIAAQQSFGFDSTQLYLLSADEEHELSTLGGLRLQFPNAILNDAAPTPYGAIMVGAHQGFTTLPFALGMDSLGQVLWCKSFPSLIVGQDQISNVLVQGDRMDLFTWGDPVQSFYRLSGRLDGSFIQSMKIIAQPTIEHRVNAVVSTGAEWGHLVVANGYGPSGSQNLYVMELDSAGIVWEVSHDHGSGASPQFEEATSVIRTANGDYVYTLLYTMANSTPVIGRMVRMDSSGTIIWSKEYQDGNDRTTLTRPVETDDGSLLLEATNNADNSNMLLKLDPAGNVVQARRYVQSMTTASPFGLLYRFDQGSLYAYRNTQFTEFTEDLNACDLQAISSVTAIDAMPTVLPSNLLKEIETLTETDLTTEPRHNTFANQLDCIYTGVEEIPAPPVVGVFPVPASDNITLDLHAFQGIVSIVVLDVQGRTVHSTTLIGGSPRNIDITALHPGVYQFHLVQGERIGQGRIVRE